MINAFEWGSDGNLMFSSVTIRFRHRRQKEKSDSDDDDSVCAFDRN